MSTDAMINSYIQKLASTDPGTRQSAILGLAQTGTKTKPTTVLSVVQALKNSLQDPDQGVRANAALVLGDIKAVSADVQAALTKAALEDNSSGVRLNAVGALRNFRAVSTFIRVLQNDKDQRVRTTAAIRLGDPSSETEAAVSALIEALQDADEALRMRAVYALGKLGTNARAAVPALTQALQDQNEIVRKGARSALERITGSGRELK